MRRIIKVFEVAAPAVEGIQGFPVFTKLFNQGIGVGEYSFDEEIEVYRKPFEVVALHGLGSFIYRDEFQTVVLNPDRFTMVIEFLLLHGAVRLAHCKVDAKGVCYEVE